MESMGGDERQRDTYTEETQWQHQQRKIKMEDFPQNNIRINFIVY